MTDPVGDLRTTFDAAASIYHQARPGYPDALFDRLFELLPSAPRILEIGPGTGQATEPMLARGATVRAIELGPHMADRLEQRLSRHVADASLAVEIGEFETVPVDAASVDAVVSATAFHWISAAQQLGRPAQWLRAGGRLAVIDTMQVTSEVDGGFYEAVQPIYARYGQDKVDSAQSPTDVRPAIHVRMAEDARCTGVTLDRYRWDQTYTAEAFRQLLLTFSGTLAMPAAARDAMLDELVAAVRDRGGTVTRPLVITLATCAFGHT